LVADLGQTTEQNRDMPSEKGNERHSIVVLRRDDTSSLSTTKAIAVVWHEWYCHKLTLFIRLPFKANKTAHVPSATGSLQSQILSLGRSNDGGPDSTEFGALYAKIEPWPVRELVSIAHIQWPCACI
jgi:hypothetical protein